MKTKNEPLFRVCRKNGQEEGFALLEYVMGAALILSGAVIAMSALGGKFGTFFENLGTWVSDRSTFGTQH